jgi:hypothetical protein
MLSSRFSEIFEFSVDCSLSNAYTVIISANDLRAEKPGFVGVTGFLIVYMYVSRISTRPFAGSGK